MTYIGEIRHGVVVLRDAPPLDEGTRVRVEVEPVAGRLRVGSPEAILAAIAQTRGWAGSVEEMDEALEYLRRTKREEADAEFERPVEEL